MTLRRRALVVGAGIAGLATAIGLLAEGWHVTVFERGLIGDVVGAGLSITPNGRAALRALDPELEQRLLRSGAVPDRFTLRDERRTLYEVDVEALQDLLGIDGPPVVGIHRGELHRILLAALPQDLLVPDTTAISVEPGEPGGTRARVLLDVDGERVGIDADLVVAADGLRSALRRSLLPEVAPLYGGSTAWRGVVAPAPRAVRQVLAWGPGLELGTVPIGRETVYWYGAVRAPRGARVRDEKEHAERVFARFGRLATDVIGATETHDLVRHDLFRLPALDNFVSGRVALVGDAAHAMLPHLGQGASAALEDAAALVRAIGRPSGRASGRLGEGLAAYDAARRPPAHRAAAASAQAARFGADLMHPWAIAARNGALRALPSPDRLAPLQGLIGRARHRF